MTDLLQPVLAGLGTKDRTPTTPTHRAPCLEPDVPHGSVPLITVVHS